MSDIDGNHYSAYDKYNRADIVASTTEGEVVLIELQVNFEADYFHRMLYGASKALVEYIDLGKKYDALKKVYSVNIVFFDLGQGEDYVYHGITEFQGIHKKDVLQLSVKQKNVLPHEKVYEIFPEYYILKINAFDNVAKDTLDEWIYFFKNNEIPDNFKARGLKEAKEILKTDSMDKEEYERYKNHLENLRYAASMIWSARVEGEVEGFEKGEKSGIEKGEKIGIEKGEKIGIEKGEKIGIEKGEKIGIEKGEKIGIEKGEKIGIEKGEKRGQLLPVFYPLRSGKSVDDIADFNNLDRTLVLQVKLLIEKYGDKAEEHIDEII
jgi:predicted transposase/invertase (TIGR01784 family)